MERDVDIDYTNWRGEREWRRVTPINSLFTHTEHHPRQQWLLLCRDHKHGGERRLFAHEGIHEWRPV